MELFMRSIRAKIAALLGLAAASLASSEARAEKGLLADFIDEDITEKIYGIGTDHFGSFGVVYLPNSVFDFEADKQNPPSKDSGYVSFGLSILPLPTLFGALGGVEADFTLGLPMTKSYFGGFGMDGGLVLQPISFRHLRASVAFGAGLNAHAYGYLKPRIAFTLVPGWADAEATFRWIPEGTSNVFGKEDGLEDDGYRELKFHGAIFIHTSEKKDSHDDIKPTNAIQLSFDYVRVDGNAKDLEHVRMRPGDYMGFGLGIAM